ncbi:MAG: pitrilysin family protein [Alphaproteobacteria bacterium]|nr:pitrilysin family protein [Alphaproteobacteria bacterium]
MNKIVFTFVAISLNVGILCAQKTQIKFEKYSLPNGLTVILHQDQSVPVVAVTTLYHVGSKNEDTARTGFAHFFEHLLFEGSKYIKRGEFDKYVTKAGGELNANTSQDRTFYYELLPSNQVNLGLWLESERMYEANILQEGVNTQREVVKEEKRQRVDNQPYGSFLDQVLSHSFKVSPYRWSPIGSIEHLNKASLDEFIAFYKKFYVPNNCVLSIAGDFDIPSIKKQIELYFGPIPKGSLPIDRVFVKEPPLGKEVRDTVYDNIQLPAVMQCFRGPSQKSSEYYAFQILSTLLAGGESSRLNKEVKEKRQLAVYMGSFPYLNEEEGLVINFGIANFGVNPFLMEHAMDSISMDLQTNLVSDRELTKVKNQIKTQLVNSKSTMAGIAEDLANNEVYFGDANLINTQLDKINAVTAQDIQQLANKYLNNNNRVVLYYLPKSQQPKQ